MNLYFLVEGGRTEKKVYRSWLTHVFPVLRFVDRPEDVSENSVRIVAGKGYPQYLTRIEEVLDEIENQVPSRVDHLFVCVDAEDFGFERRLSELESHMQLRSPSVRWTVVVQDCCIETWFLGNRRFVKANPERQPLRAFKAFYDVRERDPERMGTMRPGEVRARFHKEYLKEACRERGQSYSEKMPGPVQERPYLHELVRRHRETKHLQSFGRLAGAWEALGAKFNDTAKSWGEIEA